MIASPRWEAECFSVRGDLRGAMPRQEVVNLVDRMVCDVRQHMAQPSLGAKPLLKLALAMRRR
jgi:hypothetical protein